MGLTYCKRPGADVSSFRKVSPTELSLGNLVQVMADSSLQAAYFVWTSVRLWDKQGCSSLIRPSSCLPLSFWLKTLQLLSGAEYWGKEQKEQVRHVIQLPGREWAPGSWLAWAGDGSLTLSSCTCQHGQGSDTPSLCNCLLCLHVV